mmetsp:Transcript_11452/g.17254  ORF Transcript_11452/g.17254 Transcript_11452/m.17254 type:complete len:85 (-) Transcript_11452:2406-2660(-)
MLQKYALKILVLSSHHNHNALHTIKTYSNISSPIYKLGRAVSNMHKIFYIHANSATDQCGFKMFIGSHFDLFKIAHANEKVFEN